MQSVISIDLIRVVLIIVLIYLAYLDLRTFRLPDAFTIPMMIFGIVLNCLPTTKFTNPSNSLAGAILGYGLLWGLNLLYRRVKKQNGIGMGDAKLLSALGAWLGASALPNILLAASGMGIIGGLLWLKFHKKSRKAAFPFGPFLAIAGIIELLWPQLLSINSLLHWI